jgi:hypothetical protein
MKLNLYTVTKIIGDEYDEELKARLLRVVRKMGGVPTRSQSGMGGSQEIGEMLVAIEGQEIRIESETYVGLSISGNAQLIDRIVMQLKGVDTSG